MSKTQGYESKGGGATGEMAWEGKRGWKYSNTLHECMEIPQWNPYFV
jgi:hypothetical protein